MADLKKINQLKAKIEVIETSQIESKALQKRVLQDLKEKHGLDSLEEAEKFVAKTKKTLVKNKEILQGKYNDFISSYGDKLSID